MVEIGKTFDLRYDREMDSNAQIVRLKKIDEPMMFITKFPLKHSMISIRLMNYLILSPFVLHAIIKQNAR